MGLLLVGDAGALALRLEGGPTKSNPLRSLQVAAAHGGRSGVLAVIRREESGLAWMIHELVPPVRVEGAVAGKTSE